VPEISRFFGIVIKMFFDDHNLHISMLIQVRHCVDRHWESFCFLWSLTASRDGTGNRVGNQSINKNFSLIGRGHGVKQELQKIAPLIGFVCRSRIKKIMMIIIPPAN